MRIVEVIIFCLSFVAFSASVGLIDLISIQEWKLCNNGDTASHNYLHGRLCGSADNPELCDKRNLRNQTCESGNVFVDPANASVQIEDIFSQFDSLPLVRRLHLQFWAKDYEIVATIVDKALTPRPYLSVHAETFPHPDQKPNHKLVLMIDKYNQLYEPFLRYLGSIEYPSSKQCSDALLMVTRHDFIHPGWAGVLNTLYLEHEDYPHGTTALYVSDSNRAALETAFTDSTDCPDTPNRWECSFLATTSCPIPAQLRHCHSRHCVSKWPQTESFGAYFYKDQYVKASDTTQLDTLKELMHDPWTATQRHFAHAGGTHVPQFEYMLPPHAYRERGSVRGSAETSTIKKQKHVDTLQMGEREVLFSLQYLLRPRHTMRRDIMHTLAHFDTESGYGYGTPSPGQLFPRCVAAHVRRGDRLGPHHVNNMTRFCAEHAKDETATDYACDSRPFHSVTLLDVLRAATGLADPEVKVLLVATDDEAWLHTQTQSLGDHPEFGHWKVLTLSRPRFLREEVQRPHVDEDGEEEDEESEFRERRGWVSGVHLQATLRLLQRCEGFVGHFASGASWLIYRAMCLRSRWRNDEAGVREGVCPPMVDMRRMHG